MINSLKSDVVVPLLSQQEILNTPLSILDAVKTQFLFANLNVTSTNPIQIEINFEPNLPTLKLSSAVNAKIFKNTLHSYFLSMEIAKIANSATTPPSLDPTLFSVPEPLTDWKRFRRLMCDHEDKKCLDVIIAFLLDPNDANLLNVSHLGFAPENRKNCLSQDVEYFKDIPEKISGMDLKQRREIVKLFRLHYPTIFNQLDDLLIPLTKEIELPEQAWEKWSTVPALITFVTIALIISNISYAILPNRFLLGLNLLLRFSGIVTAIYHKLDLATMAGLINLVAMMVLRNGWFMIYADFHARSILCHLYRVIPEKISIPSLTKEIQSNRRNIKDLEQAYIYFGIPTAKRENWEFIKALYMHVREQSSSSQAKVPFVFAEQIQIILDDMDGAFKTISSHLIQPGYIEPPPPPPSSFFDID